ncbi:MAG: hypothetical protein IPH28_03680 [Cytophagaceae bacterium]|nr:hypothetical protein [Cytophagaceae bacterium]MBK9509420.1 hypothetical protein [Cytophagaceae bacterium]MBK9935152.1 hypothetical protein [Cytophagaceae bacterium]MBL0301596.1 hypothetical protein [Cytophagaceae bacterium]MBL0324420.1 hypothetical protein [Cytophagaceae bacterium]
MTECGKDLIIEGIRKLIKNTENQECFSSFIGEVLVGILPAGKSDFDVESTKIITEILTPIYNKSEKTPQDIEILKTNIIKIVEKVLK